MLSFWKIFSHQWYPDPTQVTSCQNCEKYFAYCHITTSAPHFFGWNRVFQVRKSIFIRDCIREYFCYYMHNHNFTSTKKVSQLFERLFLIHFTYSKISISFFEKILCFIFSIIQKSNWFFILSDFYVNIFSFWFFLSDIEKYFSAFFWRKSVDLSRFFGTFFHSFFSIGCVGKIERVVLCNDLYATSIITFWDLYFDKVWLSCRFFIFRVCTETTFPNNYPSFRYFTAWRKCFDFFCFEIFCTYFFFYTSFRFLCWQVTSSIYSSDLSQKEKCNKNFSQHKYYLEI